MLLTVHQFIFQWKFHENTPTNIPCTELQLNSFLIIFDLFFDFKIFSRSSQLFAYRSDEIGWVDLLVSFLFQLNSCTSPYLLLLELNKQKAL